MTSSNHSGSKEKGLPPTSSQKLLNKLKEQSNREEVNFSNENEQQLQLRDIIADENAESNKISDTPYKVSQLKQSELFSNPKRQSGHNQQSSPRNPAQSRFNRWLDNQEDDPNEDRMRSIEDKKQGIKIQMYGTMIDQLREGSGDDPMAISKAKTIALKDSKKASVEDDDSDGEKCESYFQSMQGLMVEKEIGRAHV